MEFNWAGILRRFQDDCPNTPTGIKYGIPHRSIACLNLPGITDPGGINWEGIEKKRTPMFTKEGKLSGPQMHH